MSSYSLSGGGGGGGWVKTKNGPNSFPEITNNHAKWPTDYRVKMLDLNSVVPAVSNYENYFCLKCRKRA